MMMMMMMMMTTTTYTLADFYFLSHIKSEHLYTYSDAGSKTICDYVVACSFRGTSYSYRLFTPFPASSIKSHTFQNQQKLLFTRPAPLSVRIFNFARAQRIIIIIIVVASPVHPYPSGRPQTYHQLRRRVSMQLIFIYKCFSFFFFSFTSFNSHFVV
jgi:hypothetical protein